MGQLSYSYQTKKGVAGGLYDIAPYAIESRVNGEDTAGVMKFGMGAMRGDTPGNNVLIPKTGDTADQFEGIVMTGFTNEMDMAGTVGIPSKRTVGVLRYGNAWVRVADGITPAYGDPVYLTVDGDEAGLFTNISGDGIAIKGMFKSNDSGIALVELFNQAQEA